MTSVVIQPGEVDLRLRKRRWRAVTAEEFQGFKERLKNVAPQKARAPGES